MTFFHPSSPRPPAPRASVIVLVVAVLALLAVIGTVYIVSARSARSSATAGNNAENLDLAVQAVNQQALQPIGESTFDASGVLGGMTGGAGIFGDKSARRQDMPEFNINNPGYADYGGGTGRDQSWLVANLYRPGYSSIYYNDLTMPQTRMANGTFFSPTVFDPSTGLYDIAIIKMDGSQQLTGNVGYFRVVSNPLPQIKLADGTTNYAFDDAFIQLLPFSEANGTRYRFGLRILDTSRMANLNTGIIYDMTIPSTFENAGTFNADYSLASPTIFNSANTFTQSDAPLALNGTPSAANTGRLGAWPPAANWATFTGMPDYYWSWVTFRFENPLLVTPTVLPFDLADELELRSYGWLGTLSVPRPAVGYSAAVQIWPNTLGNRNPSSNVPVGNPYRSFYTTYSYSRDLRPYPDPVDNNNVSTAYIVQPASVPWAVAPPLAPKVWPPFPAHVAALPDISTYTSMTAEQAAETLVIAATNIATAMELVPAPPPAPALTFTREETRAFAANYLTYRWNSWVQVVPPPPSAKGQPVYKLLNGPSFVDQTGLCLRTNAAMPSVGNFISTLNTNSPNMVYLGYAAQPFINEAAVSIHYAGDPVDKYVLDDCAIELYNPYNVALSLDDFKLNVNGVDIDFTGKNQWIPPRAYFVLTQTKGALDTLPTAIPAAAPHIDFAALGAASFTLEGAGKVFLMRRYWDRNAQPLWAAVDQYDVSQIATFPTSDEGAEINFVARPNKDDGTPATVNSRWVATVHDPSVAEIKHKHTGAAPDALTLGSPNDGTGAVTAYIPLNDRTLDCYTTFPYDPRFQSLIPANIADFGRIMRIRSEINPADPTLPGAPVIDSNGIACVVSAQLYSKIKAPDLRVNATQFPAEASIRFDFRAAPYFFGGTPPTKYQAGDPAAVRLIGCLAFTDRLSDLSLNLGDNNTSKLINGQIYPDLGMSKLRLPGKINVNTASAEVLASIPVLYANPQLIGAILAYRWRAPFNDTRIPVAYQLTGSLIDFTNPNEYPGYGIRALAELQIPIMAYQAAKSAVYANIADRDAAWGQMYNALTVRSDTFVVYAYLEAVRLNPRFGAPPNNDLVWYDNTKVTDDPSDGTRPLLRVARRRWLAIVDRSQANYSRYMVDTSTGKLILDPRFTQPRIVALKDLPQ